MLYSLAPIVLDHCIKPHYFSAYKKKKMKKRKERKEEKAVMNTRLRCHMRCCSFALWVKSFKTEFNVVPALAPSRMVRCKVRNLNFDGTVTQNQS